MGRDKTVGHVTNAFALVISMGTIMLVVALFGLLGACCSRSPVSRLPLIAGALLPPPPLHLSPRAFITLAPLSWAHMTPELGSSHYCTAQARMIACTPRQPHVPSMQTHAPVHHSTTFPCDWGALSPTDMPVRVPSLAANNALMRMVPWKFRASGSACPTGNECAQTYAIPKHTQRHTEYYIIMCVNICDCLCACVHK